MAKRKSTTEVAQIIVTQYRLLRRALAFMSPYTHAQELCSDIVSYNDLSKEDREEAEKILEKEYEEN